MKHLKLATLLAVLMLFGSATLVSAQDTGFSADFVTSITYQNIGDSNTTVQFSFFNQGSGDPVVISREIAASAGSSLFVGNLGGDASLPADFLGSAVLAADGPIVATLVQVPQGNVVRNRPLSNGFSSGSSQVIAASVLKNVFGQSSRVSIQNASGGNVDITGNFYVAGNPTPIQIGRAGIPAGAATYFSVEQLSDLSDGFNGSAIFTAVESGSDTAADIVGSVIEAEVSDVGTRAFEGFNNGANTIFMSTALCNVFGGQETFYAVTNTSFTDGANVTVNYLNQDGSSAGTATASVAAGNKASFGGCDTLDAGFSGSAQVTSDGAPIVVVGKVGRAGRFTAFLGETGGTSQLALPYVRYSSDDLFNNGSQQRAFLAIQNVGSNTASGVVVEYRDAVGGLVGTHALPPIPAGAKINSTAVDAEGDAARLQNFGYPSSNPGDNVFGGSAIIRADGSELIAIARIESSFEGVRVAEDYNGLATQ